MIDFSFALPPLHRLVNCRVFKGFSPQAFQFTPVLQSLYICYSAALAISHCWPVPLFFCSVYFWCAKIKENSLLIIQWRRSTIYSVLFKSPIPYNVRCRIICWVRLYCAPHVMHCYVSTLLLLVIHCYTFHYSLRHAKTSFFTGNPTQKLL